MKKFTRQHLKSLENSGQIILKAKKIEIPPFIGC